MKILVSGGAGFIGSHLCDALLAAGHSVTAVDNFVTGHPRNIAHLNGRPNFTFLHHDVTLPFEGGPWDAIFHLASPASPHSYESFAVETLLVNSQGTHLLIEMARRFGAKFLLASTSEVYGDPSVHPQPESYWGNVNPIGPRSCYDEGKRFGEALTVSYIRVHDIDARIVRIFNTYGPRSDPQDGRIIPNFVTQAVRGDPITVYGDGQQTRSYCYVSDLVEGIQRAMFFAGTKGLVVNLGTPDERSALEIAQKVKEISGSPSPIVHTPPREEEIARRKPDIALAKRLLGWEPRVSLEEGLAHTVSWFREVLVQEGVV